jgi:hypothetical protein
MAGGLLHSADNKPIQFASIALYNFVTGKAVDGTVADEKGKFVLTKLAPGEYQLMISFIGYSDTYMYNRGIRVTFNYKIGKMSMDASRKRTKSVKK